MSARPRAQHPAPGLLAPPAPGTVPGSEHSPYLKAVLAAGYAQHTARRATTGCGDYCDYCDAAPLEVPDVAGTESVANKGVVSALKDAMNKRTIRKYKDMGRKRLQSMSEDYENQTSEALKLMKEMKDKGDTKSAEYERLNAMVKKNRMESFLIAKAMRMLTNSSSNRGTDAY